MQVSIEMLIHQIRQKYAKEIASSMEQVFMLWYDKDILNIQNIFILFMNKTC